MLKIRSSVLFLLLCCVTLLGVISATASPNNSLEPIKIGSTLPLTGRYAFVGEAERDGMILAAESINQAGGINGRPLQIIFADNAGEPRMAVSGVQKLLEVDKVDVIFSAFTHITQSIKAIVARHKKVMLYSSTVKTIAEESPYFFRDYVDAEVLGSTLANAVHDNKHHRLVYVGEQGDACVQYAQAFRAQADKLGISIIAQEEFLSGDPDLRAVLLRAMRHKPEALVFCAWRDTHIVMKQFKELGLLHVPTYHSFAPFLPEADTPEMRKIYEENKAISMWFTFLEDSKDALAMSFREKFQERFGREPRADSAFFYDDVKILSAAIVPCLSGESLNSECLIKELLNTNYVGPSGRISFDTAGNAYRDVLVVRVQDGKWIPVTPAVKQ